MKKMVLLFAIMAFSYSFAGTSFENDVGDMNKIENAQIMGVSVATITVAEVVLISQSQVDYTQTVNLTSSVNTTAVVDLLELEYVQNKLPDIQRTNTIYSFINQETSTPFENFTNGTAGGLYATR
tara:strand:+ start:895 stop:1269 length:375 start_codon:yes stop_codon:yes gene_type:complete